MVRCSVAIELVGQRLSARAKELVPMERGQRACTESLCGFAIAPTSRIALQQQSAARGWHVSWRGRRRRRSPVVRQTRLILACEASVESCQAAEPACCSGLGAQIRGGAPGAVERSAELQFAANSVLQSPVNGRQSGSTDCVLLFKLSDALRHLRVPVGHVAPFWRQCSSISRGQWGSALIRPRARALVAHVSAAPSSLLAGRSGTGLYFITFAPASDNLPDAMRYDAVESLQVSLLERPPRTCARPRICV